MPMTEQQIKPRRPGRTRMPKQLMIAVTIVLLLTLGLGIATVALIKSKQPNKGLDIIDRKEAYQIALDDAKKKKKKVTFEKLFLDPDAEPVTYEIFFYDKNNYWEYYLNAENGKILNVKKYDGGGPRLAEE